MSLGALRASIARGIQGELRMDLRDVMEDITAEELDPRLELQILVDPLSASATPQDNNNNCKKKGACVIQVPQ